MKTIDLTQGQKALVDDEDFEWLSQWKWSAAKQGSDKWRAMRTVKNGSRQRVIRMHRLIMNAKTGQTVDHINGNPLDNRRANLRFATQQQQMINRRGWVSRPKTSRYKGVYWQKDINRWRSRFREKYLGTFTNEEDAARAYDAEAHKFSPFARLNFPEEFQ